MKALNPEKTAFGRHETFPLRYGWLTKGFEAVQSSPNLFDHPEQAMIKLGVGRNMVNAMQYWLQAVGVVDFTDTDAYQTKLGDRLLGEGADAYLEDEATLWIIHWLLASNAEQATGIWWFFNRFAQPQFHDKEALCTLGDFIEHKLNSRRSQSTLKSEVSTLLRLYAPEPGRHDEHLDSPLAELQLIEPEGGGRYQSPRRMRPYLPPVALHFALSQCFEDTQAAALPVKSMLYGNGAWAAPGAVFRLTDEGLMSALNQVLEHYPNAYELRDTAGVHQLYRGSQFKPPLDVLWHHYQSSAR